MNMSAPTEMLGFQRIRRIGLLCDVAELIIYCILFLGGVGREVSDLISRSLNRARWQRGCFGDGRVYAPDQLDLLSALIPNQRSAHYIGIHLTMVFLIRQAQFCLLL